ncbi:MAG: DUF2141 domain-containing protein [Flavobacteriaceae bacterium]|nr:DUF2141 domain-containing protein [Flavobacteriaceae bacterium]MCI5087872.1 DUF2141 domain-containing protein [Flavobacteriaceae bacterium]
MKWFFLALGPILLWLHPKQTPAYTRISIHVQEVKAPLGVLRIALYDKEAHFLDFKSVFASKVVPATKGTTTVLLDSIPAGTYAIALYQDQNNNGQMDKNWFGIPTEPLGFSKAKLRTFGPPKFKDCMFVLDGDMRIDIPLENN